MKNFLALVICALCLIQLPSFGQAFKKHDLIFTGGFGGSTGWFYRTSLNGYKNIYYGNPYGNETGVHAGYNFPFTGEFAVHNKWSFGLSFSQNKYANSSSDKSNANNFGVFGAFHFVSKEKVELYTRLNFGFCRLTYEESDDYSYYDYNTGILYRDDDAIVYHMNGGFIKPSFGLRVFFTKHVGLFTDAGIGGYFLSTNNYENQVGPHVFNEEIKYNLFGAEITAGVAFKL